MIAHHALVLNLHQPAGNLEHLLEEQPWEAKEILFALDRMPRSLWGWEDHARVHLSLSGTLLETLSNPDFQRRVYGIVDCGKLLWHLQNQSLFDILGTGYYHPVLPLIPAADRDLHLRRWQGIARHLFWRQDFNGFWPPEMSFAQELIPLARRFGYRYVMIDSENIEPVGEMSWQELRYRPHIARQGEDEIIVVVRDRELSDAQESGMDLDWFLREVAERTKWCDFPPLVTTASDGENGGWFRNVTEGANFWSAFYLPLLEQAASAQAGVRPSFIKDYLDRYGAHGEVRIRTAAWNTGWHNGQGFTQWTGSEAQRRTYSAYQDLSRHLHAARERLATHPMTPEIDAALETATWRLLRAETSCNTYWGEAWVERAEADLMAARAALKQAEGAANQTTPSAASASHPGLPRNSTPPGPASSVSHSIESAHPAAAPTTAAEATATHPSRSDTEHSLSAHSPETDQ